MIILDSREDPDENQELWNLAEVRFPIWYTQHVQGVQRSLRQWGSDAMLQRHGCPTSCTCSFYTDNQGGSGEGHKLSQTPGEAVPRFQDQVPVAQANPA